MSAQTDPTAAPSVIGDPALERFVARNLRRNLTLLAADYGFFGLGMTFASLSTIAPAFAERLGASNFVIGLIPALMTLGYGLPALFTANYTERLPRKLRFILTYTTLERLPYLALALGAYFLAVQSPGLTLVLLLACLAIVSQAGGALMPAWLDMISKVVPTTYRGRLFAFGSTLASFLGLGGAALVGYYLATYAFPLDYALSFGTGFLCLVASYVCLALVREPAVVGSKPHVGLREYLGRLPEIVRSNHSFRWYLVARLVGYFAQMAGGFYTVYSLRVLHVAESDVAVFTFILLAGQTVANVAFGYVADHIGHKPVLVAGGLAMAIGNVVAIVSNSAFEVCVVFVFYSIWIAAVNVSMLTVSIEFAPPDEVPTYTGLASTAVAPAAFVAPLIGGVLADAVGYPVVFALAAVAALAYAGVLLARVRDPRHRHTG